jgi:hypothetical protein
MQLRGSDRNYMFGKPDFYQRNVNSFFNFQVKPLHRW